MEPLVVARTPTTAPRPTGAVVSFPVRTEVERPSLAALFASEESGLLRYAIGLVRQRMVAEELVQEAFLRLHQAWAEVENPRAWLYRTLRNLALNHRRDHPGEAELHDETAAQEARLPVESISRDEAVGAMRLLLAELPEEDRELIDLKYRDGLKYEEISRRTGLSVGNVGYRLHHALKSLAARLRHAGIEDSRG